MRGATTGATGTLGTSGYDEKTSSGGTFSPSFSVNFAIFLRRISGIVGAWKRKDGVKGVGIAAIDEAPELLRDR